MIAPYELWIAGIRIAGVLHLVTLLAASRTPVPPDWEDNLDRLPLTHRRFALAQNAFIGATIAFAGVLCLGCAPELVTGSPLARTVCGGIALWWGGRLAVLGWLRVRPHLVTRRLRVGFRLLLVECAVYALAFGRLALGPAVSPSAG